jgi:hypothetical protein
MEEETLRTRKAIQPDMPRRLHHGSGMLLEIMTLVQCGLDGTKGSTWSETDAPTLYLESGYVTSIWILQGGSCISKSFRMSCSCSSFPDWKKGSKALVTYWCDWYMSTLLYLGYCDTWLQSHTPFSGTNTERFHFNILGHHDISHRFAGSKGRQPQSGRGQRE